jgi:hypothetical protein
MNYDRKHQHTLDEIIREWDMEIPSNPNLESAVFRQIQKDHAQARCFWSYSCLNSPAIAALFLVCCSLSGVLMAQFSAPKPQLVVSEKMAARYIQHIDPIITIASLNQLGK